MQKKAEKFDVIVIGAGSGLEISSIAAEKGLKTAIIEHGPFGGTCLNRGCIPSKMLIHSADIMQAVEKAGIFGIKAKALGCNWQKIMKRVWAPINQDAKELEKTNRQAKNITVYRATAEFTGKKILKAGNELITADKIFICAGARPFVPPIKGLDTVPYTTSKEALKLKKQPKDLLIIGGGYIGAELGHFFSALGTKVTIVQRAGTMLAAEDSEIAKAFTQAAKKKFNLLLNASAEKAEKNGSKIVITAKQGNKTKKLSCETLLVATGRTPNTDILRTDKTGVKTDKKGFVKVNNFMETNVPGIWAIGDITGKYMFKHCANLEAGYAAHNALGSAEKIPVDYTAMPHAVFASPQIAGVGKTEQEIKKENKKYAVGRYNYSDTGMGTAIADKTGFVKVLADQKGSILGCHIMGTEAASLIHEVIVAMKAGLGVRGITDAVHIHPALPEVVQRAFTDIEF